MKKITTIILAIAMAASLTACSTTENNPQNDPNTSSDNKIVQVDQNGKPEDTEGSKDNNEDKNSDSNSKDDGNASDEKTDNKNEGDPDSSNTSGDKTDDNDNKSPEDKNDNKDDNKTDDKTENKTEDNKNPADDNGTSAAVLPLKEYPAGSYFTYDGKPCTDHSNCTWTTECNCVNFDLSIQSPGFAKYVYCKVTGKHVSLADKTAKDIDLTAETAKSSLLGLPLGTYVAVQTNGDRFHAFIVTDTSENGITVYQANYGGGCVVSLVTYSWADFAYRFPHLNYYVK